MLSKNQLKLIRQLEQAKHRRSQRLFVAEGPKVVGDLLRHGFRPQLLIATDAWQPQPGAPDSATTSLGGRGSAPSAMTDVQRVTDEELRRASFLQHPQQVLALFPIPDEPDVPEKPSQLTLALDGVQDPGTLGTIIRLADWFGIERIYCSRDTADCWNPKVVQATMGSIARVHINYCDLPGLLAKADVPVYGTLLDGENLYTQTLPADRGGIIVMGNEGKGLSPEVRQLVTHRLLIPCYHYGPDGPESLNVAIATAIVCAEFRRSGF